MINKLLLNTLAGKVDWEETVQPEEYIATIGINSIIIGALRDSDGDLVPFIKLQDEFGSTVDDFIYSDIEEQNAYTIMVDIYKKARGIAKGIDKVLNDIISQLESDEEIPF